MTDKLEESTHKAIAGCLLILAIPAVVAWEGFVGWKLWTWFLVPLGGASLTYGAMTGVMLAFSYLLITNSRLRTYETSKELYTALVRPFTLGAIMLGMGWVLHLLIH